MLGTEDLMKVINGDILCPTDDVDAVCIPTNLYIHITFNHNLDLSTILQNVV